MVNGADEVPGFVLARSYNGKEQFVLGVVWRKGSQSLQGELAYPPTHFCPLDNSPQVADSHTCVLGTLAAVSPGWGRGHRALGYEDEVGGAGEGEAVARQGLRMDRAG